MKAMEMKQLPVAGAAGLLALLLMVAASTLPTAVAEDSTPPGYDIILMLGQSNSFGNATDALPSRSNLILATLAFMSCRYLPVMTHNLQRENL